MNISKAYNLIGLSQKSGRISSGEFSSEKSIRSNTSKLVIIAEDASKNTKKKFTNRCAHYKVPLIEFGSKKTLGNAIGKEERAVISINDNGFASSITDLIVRN